MQFIEICDTLHPIGHTVLIYFNRYTNIIFQESVCFCSMSFFSSFDCWLDARDTIQCFQLHTTYLIFDYFDLYSFHRHICFYFFNQIIDWIIFGGFSCTIRHWNWPIRLLNENESVYFTDISFIIFFSSIVWSCNFTSVIIVTLLLLLLYIRFRISFFFFLSSI